MLISSTLIHCHTMNSSLLSLLSVTFYTNSEKPAYHCLPCIYLLVQFWYKIVVVLELLTCTPKETTFLLQSSVYIQLLLRLALQTPLVSNSAQASTCFPQPAQRGGFTQVSHLSAFHPGILKLPKTFKFAYVKLHSLCYRALLIFTIALCHTSIITVSCRIGSLSGAAPIQPFLPHPQ